MLRLTRLLARKPPGFTSKLNKQPETATKPDSDDSGKDKTQNPDYMKEMQNIVNTLQDKLRTAKSTSDSKTTNSETPKSVTEENEVKSMFGETLGKKRKTVTEDKDGNDISFAQKGPYEQPLRSNQIKIRQAEVLSVIKDLKELSPELHFEIFGGFAANAKIDTDELILAGHSYGAITMIAADSQLAEAE